MNSPGANFRQFHLALLGLVLLAGCPSRPATPSKPAPAKGPVTEQAVCSAPKATALRVDQGRAPPKEGLGPIETIRFRGVDHPTDELTKLLTSAPGQPVDAEKIRTDITRLWALEKFDDISVEAETTDDGVILTYVLVPRRPTGRVFFQGVRNLPQEDFALANKLRTDELFARDKLTRTWSLLKYAYATAGYHFAKIETHLLQAEVVHVCFKVTEGPKVTITSWQFQGVHALDDEQLRKHVDLRNGTANVVGGVYRGDLYTQSKRLIQAHYYDLGYLAVKIDPPQVSFSDDKREISVTVLVEEGPQYHIGNILFSGELLVPGQDYHQNLTIKSGDQFCLRTVREEVEAIRKFQQSIAEFSLDFGVTPVTKLDPEKRLIHLEFRIE